MKNRCLAFLSKLCHDEPEHEVTKEPSGKKAEESGATRLENRKVSYEMRLVEVGFPFNVREPKENSTDYVSNTASFAKNIKLSLKGPAEQNKLIDASTASTLDKQPFKANTVSKLDKKPLKKRKKNKKKKKSKTSIKPTYIPQLANYTV